MMSKYKRKVHLTFHLVPSRSYTIACKTRMHTERDALHTYTHEFVTCLSCKKLLKSGALMRVR